MESKEHQSESSNNQAPNINIDISSDQDEANVKAMNLESSQESRAGLSKEELMKFANQPFWNRLRNFLFASFWILWLSILVAAIGYVYNSPNCGPKLVSAAATAAANSTMANGASGGSSSS